MNKFKKLILSLTITLLSCAGVEAMAIPQISTYRDLGRLVNQYSVGDFLSNKHVFGADNEGLLEALLRGYDDIPVGSRSLAENLFQSKFRLSSSQLRARLSSIAPTRAVPAPITPVSTRPVPPSRVPAPTRPYAPAPSRAPAPTPERPTPSPVIPQTISNAEEVIRNLTKEKNDLQSQVATLSSEVNDLTNKINTTPASDSEGLKNLQAKLTGVERTADRLNDTVINLTNDKARLQQDINDLRVHSAPISDVQRLQNQLNFADSALATATQRKAQYQAKINELQQQLTSALSAIPGAKQANKIFKKIDQLVNNLTNYNTSTVATITAVNGIDLANPANSIDALNSVKNLQDIATDADNLSTAVNNELAKYEGEIQILDTKWTALNIPKTSPLAKAFDQKTKPVDQNMQKIASKIRELDNVMNLARAREKDIQQKEQAVVVEIQNWAQGDLKELLAIQTQIGFEEALAQQNFGAFTEQELNREINTSQTLLTETNEPLEAFEKLATRALPYPKAQAELATLQNRIDKLKELKTIITENLAKLEAEAKKRTGTPAPTGVSDVNVDLNNYSLSFKIGNIEFKADAQDETPNEDFVHNIINITDNDLETAGREIVTKAKNPSEYITILGDVLKSAYDKATTNEERNKIRTLVKPIFSAYKHAGIGYEEAGAYKLNLTEYGLNNNEII